MVISIPQGGQGCATCFAATHSASFIHRTLGLSIAISSNLLSLPTESATPLAVFKLHATSGRLPIFYCRQFPAPLPGVIVHSFAIVRSMEVALTF